MFYEHEQQNVLPWARCNLVIDIRYPSNVICLLREKRPTNASSTLLLAVAPPAHNRLRRQYDDTFEFHVLLPNVSVPVGLHLRKAA